MAYRLLSMLMPCRVLKVKPAIYAATKKLSPYQRLPELKQEWLFEETVFGLFPTGNFRNRFA